MHKEVLGDSDKVKTDKHELNKNVCKKKYETIVKRKLELACFAMSIGKKSWSWILFRPQVQISKNNESYAICVSCVSSFMCFMCFMCLDVELFKLSPAFTTQIGANSALTSLATTASWRASFNLLDLMRFTELRRVALVPNTETVTHIVSTRSESISTELVATLN